jgi:hypothetical protein
LQLISELQLFGVPALPVPLTITRAADAGGALTAIRHAVVSGTSRSDQFVEPSAVQTRHLYSCPNVVTLMDRINQHVAAGVDALHPAVLRMIDLKAAIRQVDLAACRKLASAALELASPREVRDLVSASKK